MDEKINQLDVFLAGEYCNLIALNEEHVWNSSWYGWFNNLESTKGTEHHRFPNTRALQLKFFQEEVTGRKDNLILGITELDEGKLVGVISLSSINYVDRKANIAIMIGEEKYRSVSIALDAHKMLIAHGFDELNLHRICGGTIAKEWAEVLCRSLGFSLEGVLVKDQYKNGEYRDVYQFALLRDKYVALKEENQYST